MYNASVNYKSLLNFYKNKSIFITGHTGFKGSWLTYILISAGATVTGYSLTPPTEPSLFKLLRLDTKMRSHVGDVRDLKHLCEAVSEAKPDILFHLAAQPIVRDSYRDPVGTYQTNVMGTVNVCEVVRLSHLPFSAGGLLPDAVFRTSTFTSSSFSMSEVKSGEGGGKVLKVVDGEGQNSGAEAGEWQGIRSFLNVTTDKVYRNNEWEWGYRETDFLDGFDPYSNSKSCSEIVTHGYINSFYKAAGVSCSTARAGNVIGGGDFANDRIVPDCIRSLLGAASSPLLSTSEHEKRGTGEGGGEAVIKVRNPYSTRPYEHVLEPLFAYLLIAAKQYEDPKYADFYNVGPDEVDCITTGNLVNLFCKKWNSGLGTLTGVLTPKNQSYPSISWSDVSNPNDASLHEANFLKLDCSKLKSVFSWHSRWHIDEALEQVVAFTRVLMESSSDSEEMRAEKLRAEMDREIKEFIRYTIHSDKSQRVAVHSILSLP